MAVARFIRSVLPFPATVIGEWEGVQFFDTIATSFAFPALSADASASDEVDAQAVSVIVDSLMTTSSSACHTA